MLFTVLLVCVFGDALIANAQTCYYPDGSVSSRDIPCHSPSVGDGASACCGYPDMCLSNGLCLSQSGAEVISRGSCTDQSWQSPECSQYCNDVDTSGGAPIHLLHYYQNQWLFCCSPGNAYNSTCMDATKGSTAPFQIEAGQVIFNRTSGSTSPNDTTTAPVTVHSTAAFTATVTATVTATATASASKSLDAPSTSAAAAASSSSSSKNGTAIGAAFSALLGVLLLVTLILLWRERKTKQTFRKDAHIWEGKYAQLVQKQNTLVDVGGAEHQPPQQLDGWNPSELYGKPYVAHQLEAWRPGEMDATQIP